MRELMIALIVACTLLSVAEAFYKMAIDGLHIAVPPA
jgi:hypothetical protein